VEVSGYVEEGLEVSGAELVLAGRAESWLDVRTDAACELALPRTILE
jgi:hypothetical protein